MTGADPGAATVLLVDDDQSVVDALVRVVEGLGYRALGTTDPTRVPALIEAERADVLVSDVDMPVLDGLALVERVRSRFPEVVRILLTGRASLATALEAINRGEVFRFLTKPWDAEVLKDTLQAAAARAAESRWQRDDTLVSLRRSRLLESLEREHPGSTSLALVGGVHRLDGARIERTLAALGAPVLRALCEGARG